jgi:superfamily II DNA or RNA helicase
MQVDFKTGDMASYRQFLRLKKLPTYSWLGTSAIIPDEYSHLLDGDAAESRDDDIRCSEFLFDYQRAIAEMAIRKQKFAVFADCGLGKTAILLEFAKHAAKSSRKVLIVSPLMVIPQTIDEAARFYPGMGIAQINAANLQYWLNSTDSLDSQIGITNYEAIRDDLTAGHLDALILDESSMLKSHYGAWGTRLIELGRGMKWKLALTGTPAPNDRIEYANHAVFCDHFRTVNEFLARYFVNRGETQNRWEIKPHALKPFYRDLSHWCIFLTNPATYGWKDNCGTIPPIHVHIDYIDLTGEQRKASQSLTGGLFVNNVGGIGSRGKLSQLAKGRLNGEDVATNKPEFIRQMVESWPEESTLVWCRYNDEQDAMERVFPDAASISGDTPQDKRLRLIDEFKCGDRKVLISKPKILGFGLNLQIATRQVFSGLQDSYEEFYQAVKRSNRVGSTNPLNVHIPITELEEPMIQTVLEKAKRVQADTEQQEKLFLEVAMNSPERIGRSKGYAAGYEGLPRTDNPGGVEGDAWDKGWVDGNASVNSK